MDAKTKQMILDKIAEMLDDPTCDIHVDYVEAGLIRRPDGPCYMESGRAGVGAITIKVRRGCGGIVDESPAEAANT